MTWESMSPHITLACCLVPLGKTSRPERAKSFHASNLLSLVAIRREVRLDSHDDPCAEVTDRKIAQAYKMATCAIRVEAIE